MSALSSATTIRGRPATVVPFARRTRDGHQLVVRRRVELLPPLGAASGSQRRASSTKGAAPTAVEARLRLPPRRSGRQMLGAQRHGDDEGGAFAQPALGADRPAVQLDQLLDQGQSDAAAFVGAAAHVLDAMEALKEAGHFLGGDAHAGVAHASARRWTIRRGA